MALGSKIRATRRDLKRQRSRREAVGRDIGKRERERDRHRAKIHEAEVDRKDAKEKREDARARGADERVRTLTRRIEELDRSLKPLYGEERELTRRIRELRGRRGEISENAKEKLRELRALIRRKKRRRINFSPGAPHWGGSEDVIERDIEPVARKSGATETSGKRSETYGNPTSDHHVSQLLASARDWAIANNLYCWLKAKVASALGIGSGDYVGYYIDRGPHTFRVQQICENHGTGPHLHDGVRRVS